MGRVAKNNSEDQVERNQCVYVLDGDQGGSLFSVFPAVHGSQSYTCIEVTRKIMIPL